MTEQIMSTSALTVLKHTARGLTLRETAKQMGISRNLARKYLEAAEAALGALTAPHAVAIGLLSGVLVLDEHPTPETPYRHPVEERWAKDALYAAEQLNAPEDERINTAVVSKEDGEWLDARTAELRVQDLWEHLDDDAAPVLKKKPKR